MGLFFKISQSSEDERHKDEGRQEARAEGGVEVDEIDEKQ